MAHQLSIGGAGTQSALRAFLGAPTGTRRFRLVLPEFGGPVGLSDDGPSPGFSYRGHAYAERDARAASHVQALIDQVAEMGNVTIEGARTGVGQQDISFLFGSRSNQATQAFLSEFQTDLFRFEFTNVWTILCNGGRFSLPDPSRLSPVEYAATDDYGLIARVRSASLAPVFLLAGLGGRATEGCGLYFREHWDKLESEFSGRDFAMVLRFSAPFGFGRAEQVASVSQFARAF